MKHLMNLRVTTVLATAALLGACDALRPDNVISIKADRASLRADETANLTITFTNRADTTVHAEATNSYICGNPLSVADTLGRNVQMPGVACIAMAFPPISVLPGATVTYQASWLPAVSSVGGVPIQPGIYYLTASVWAGVEMKSSPLALVLTP
jgi:hypothetical protein